MGTYFANLHVKNNGFSTENIRKPILAYAGEKNYISTDRDNADLAIGLYTSPNGAWTSVYSESFTHSDVLSLAPLISDAVQADVLSLACVDSDYLFLQLLNTAEKCDLWLNIGKSYELPAPKRSNLAAWKKRIKDFEAFKAAAKQDYVFAEDFLEQVQNDLSLPFEQSIGNISPDAVEWLYFSLPDRKIAPNTHLGFVFYNLVPCRPGQKQACFVYNSGDTSRGISAMFVGDYIEHDDITIDQAYFCYNDERNHQISRPITFQKKKTESGQWIYYWEDPDFIIPRAVSPDLPPKISFQKRADRQIGIRYILNGNPRKFLDICLRFAPLSNREKGSCQWLVWAHHKSKRAFIESHNKHEEDLMQYGKEPEFYDLDAYDLD